MNFLNIRFQNLLKLRAVRYLLLIGILLFAWSCSDLEVENKNDLDAEKALNSSTLKTFAEDSYVNFWQATHKPNIQLTAIVMADQFTASWGNFGWLKSSGEPRAAWDNSEFADDDKVLENFWYNTYSALYQANKSLQMINKGVLQGDTSVVGLTALCYFVQGMGLGHLGLVFDSASIVNENNLETKIGFSSYKTVVDSAISALEKTIAICNTNNFTLKSGVINGVSVNQDYMKRLSYSYIIRFMVLKARNAEQNALTDWQKVSNYALNGIVEDFGPTGNGLPSAGGRWFDLNYYYLVNPGFARVDCRLINLMDPTYPSTYPSDGTTPIVHVGTGEGEALSVDLRLKSDFEYLPSVNFEAGRGYYHFSHYRYKRYDKSIFNASGKLIEYRKYELDMYRAEAYWRLNQNEFAIMMLNSSFRKGRGGISNMASTTKPEEVLNTIFYEREIELLGQGFFVGFCDMRRRDLLQKGTPLHFPVPSKELQTQLKTVYTFGGANRADGTGTSKGGWK